MELPDYYTNLFNAVTDAINALNQQNYGFAKEILIQAQLKSEDLYLEKEQTDCHVASLLAMTLNYGGHYEICKADCGNPFFCCIIRR